MKVLIVNTLEKTGGAAIAANRLHKALIKKGLDSQMLVQKKFSGDDSVVENEKKLINKIRPTLDSLPLQLYKKRSKTMFSPAWLPFSPSIDVINKINPDIVHLHWINSGMFRIEDLKKIKAPVVWSLHDMWAFTGGCHYTEHCLGFKKKCGNCKVLNSSRRFDLSKIIFNRKMKIYSKIRTLHFVGLSKWITKEAQSSSLIKDKAISNLPNPIDTGIFKPFDRTKARALFDLPQERQLILFGAISGTKDKRKGFDELGLALQLIDKKDVEFVVFGSDRPKEPLTMKYKTHFVGRLEDEYSLRALYSAADVMVVPSIQEAFGQTASEALSCGVPSVAFDSTGVSDIIDHKQNGYLAKPFSVKDLADGIEWVLNHRNAKELSKNAREKVLRNFDSRLVAGKYIDLYKRILLENDKHNSNQ